MDDFLPITWRETNPFYCTLPIAFCLPHWCPNGFVWAPPHGPSFPVGEAPVPSDTRPSTYPRPRKCPHRDSASIESSPGRSFYPYTKDITSYFKHSTFKFKLGLCLLYSTHCTPPNWPYISVFQKVSCQTQKCTVLYRLLWHLSLLINTLANKSPAIQWVLYTQPIRPLPRTWPPTSRSQKVMWSFDY